LGEGKHPHYPLIEIYTLLDKKWFSMHERYKSLYDTVSKVYLPFSALIDYLSEEEVKEPKKDAKKIKDDFLKLSENHSKIKNLVEGALNQSGHGLPTESEF
jgi:hypothetical protein